MKNFFKYNFCFLLSLMILFITSCGKKTDVSLNNVYDNSVSVDLNSIISTLDYSESFNGIYTYKSIERPFSDGFYVSENIASSLINSNTVGVVSSGTLNGDNVLLYSELNINGNINSSYLELPDSVEYVSDDENALLEKETSSRLIVSYSFSNVHINSSKIIGLVNIYYNCFSTDTGESCYSFDSVLCSWSLEGELLYSENLTRTDSQQSLIVMNSFCSGNDYLIVISDLDGTYKVLSFNLSKNMISYSNISNDSVLLEIDDLISLKNGLYVAFYKGEDGLTKASYFDFDKLIFSSDLNLPDYICLNGYSEVAALDSGKFVFSNYIGIFSYDINDGSFDEIMDYVNSDFDGYYVDDILFIDEQNFFGSYTSMTVGTENIYYFSKKSERDENKAITVLGTYKLSANTRKQLYKYNIADNAYRVVIQEYSLKDSLEQPERGYEQLESDILTGNGPDFAVIDTSKVDINKLADNNELVSWNYITGLDSDFSSSVYLTNVLDAYAINGFDYIFVYDFIYRTYLGNADVIGNTNSFSIKTFKKATNDSDVILYSGISQEDYLEKLIKFDAADFIETAENTSYFNCDEFITLLEYSKKLPVESVEISGQDSLFRTGGLLLEEKNIISADGFWEDAYRNFDGNAVLAGFPGLGTSTSIVEYVDFPFLIMAEGNISGAWDVVKTFYSLEYQNSISNAIPVNSYSFDDWGNETLYYSHFSSYGASSESDYLKKTYYYDGQEYEIPFIDEDNISKIKDTIKSTKKSAFSNEVIYNIILEEAYEYINGNQTAKQAASNIDDRINSVLQGN